MIDIAFAILAFALVWNAMKKWWYRRAWRAASQLNGELVKANYQLQTRLNSKVAGEMYAAKVCDEDWPEFFDVK